MNQTRPLVIGYPRSGFTLLISVIAEIRQLHGVAVTPGQGVMGVFCAGAGAQVAARIKAAFARLGVGTDLLYNGNFQELAGGPKWLKAGSADTACFRKYIGVRGLGDFTLITAHPRAVMDCYDVLHSHVAPSLWAASPAYADIQKFTSLRDPAGTLASACFSLNALASEYIQKFVDTAQDNDELRQKLALYKLSDRHFFGALITPYKAYLEEFAAVAGHYTAMRWENLISTPVPTIQRIAAAMHLDVTMAEAASIWTKLDHVNLTGAHQHNLRRGNEHLDMMHEAGLFAAAAYLGYKVPERLDEAAYTPFQQQLAAALAQGRVIRAYEDEDLFGFAFNKSNIDWQAFGFKSYGWRGHTQIERAGFADETMMMAVWDEAEAACAIVNGALAPWLGRAGGDDAAAAQGMAEVARPLFDDEPAWQAWRTQLLAACQGKTPAMPEPVLLQTVGHVNIVAYAGRYYALPQSLGPVDLQTETVALRPGVLIGDQLDDLLSQLNAPVV
jgi:hypothetical protein